MSACARRPVSSAVGVYAGWPSIFGSLGPMTRTVLDGAKLLDAMAGYDSSDPVTALGYGKQSASYAAALEGASAKQALKGARLGVLRESMGFNSDPSTDDFARVSEVFEDTLEELRAAGAILVEIEIPDLKTLLAKRANAPGVDEASYIEYISRSPSKPYASMAEAMQSPLYQQVTPGVKMRWEAKHTDAAYFEYIKAREELMFSFMKVMADNQLDAMVHKAVEHEPTLIRDGVNPPFITQKGAPAINTFLTFVPTIVVPSRFTSAGLPAGLTFLGRPYSDETMLRLAYAYEQATQHRKEPALTA